MSKDVFQKISKGDADVLLRHGVDVYTKISIDEESEGYYAFTPRPAVKRIPKGTWLKLRADYDRPLPEAESPLGVCVQALTSAGATDAPMEKDSMTGYLVEKTNLGALAIRGVLSELLYQFEILEAVTPPETQAPAEPAKTSRSKGKTSETSK